MTANFIYTIGGNGTGTYSGDGGAAAAGTIYHPYGVSLDGAGNVYFADFGNNRVRIISKATGPHFGQSMTANSIYTIAGGGAGRYSGTGGVAISDLSQLYSPRGVRTDAGGNLYFSDYSNNLIRFIPHADGTYFGQSMKAQYLYDRGNGGVRLRR